MTTDAFRLHARIVLHFYASFGTTKQILNLLLTFMVVTYLPTVDLPQVDNEY